MSVTLHDVAREAGVSIKTVSNVINERPHVSAATRRKVMSAVATLKYQPNLSARSLRSGRTGVIGLAIPELSLSYFAQLADEIINEAESRGLVVLIEQTRGGNRERELEVLTSPRRRLTDGLIFSPLGLTEADVATQGAGAPIVLLGERSSSGAADHVSMQNVPAARAATSHLIDLGRRRIAVIGADTGEKALRFEGYRLALEDAGIPVDPELVVTVDHWHRSHGAEAIRQLLARGVQFDGLFAMNDELALGAIRGIREVGISIPDDVAVIGFDDVEEGRYSMPSLSTVDPGRADMAAMAVDALLERINGAVPEDAPARQLKTGFRIITRESAPAAPIAN